MKRSGLADLAEEKTTNDEADTEQSDPTAGSSSDDQLRKQREEMEADLKAAISESVRKMIEEAIASTGAASMQDMGKIMGLLKPQMAGRADMGKVSGLIKQRL